jgi:predicted aspartyl protease
MAHVRCGFDSVPGADGRELLVNLGPTLLVDIGFDPNWTPSSATTPTAGIVGEGALVDTGATESCIDSLLATNLGLPIADKRNVSGVHGSQEVAFHLAQIHVPSLGFTMYGLFAGVHLVAGGQVHKALLGRTFLRNFRMLYEGTTGAVTISRP